MLETDDHWFEEFFNYKFNGKIDKITIDLKEIKTADKVVIEKATKEAAHKKALSD